MATYGGNISSVRVIQFYERMDDALRRIDSATAHAFSGNPQALRDWISGLMVLIRLVITGTGSRKKLSYFKEWTNEMIKITNNMTTDNPLSICFELNILTHKVYEYASNQHLLLLFPKGKGILKGLKEYGLEEKDLKTLMSDNPSISGYRS